MSGIPFENTRRGAEYYDHHIPRIAKSLERIANALEKPNVAQCQYREKSPCDDTLEKVAEDFGLTVEGVRYALSQYQKILCEITHGMLSKLSYDANDVIRYAQDKWCETCDLLLLKCEGARE